MHPGGPFWAKKDEGAWSIPKGEYDDGEDPMACALREFEEELGSARRRRATWSSSAPCASATARRCSRGRPRATSTPARSSNTFTMEWPPRSGQSAEFPEVDRAEWFPVEVAREKLNPAQAEFLDRL